MVLCSETANHRKEGWEMRNLKILLIEDCQKEAKEIVARLNERAEQKNDSKYTFHFEALEGTIEDGENGHKYYESGVMKQIEKFLNDDHEEQIGLLLDVLLTKEDIENTLSSYYPQADLAKKIYFKFCDRIPIYMITGTATFATRSDVIMGIDLSNQFIAKNALLRYKLESEIDKLFLYYKQYFE